MSKKSRRRNKRLLGALAALGGAAMLANRRRNQANVELDLPKSNTFTKPNMLDVAGPSKKVYQDDIMRGGKGTKFVKPNLRFGQVIDKQGDVKTLTPFKNAGLTLSGGDKKLKLTDNSLRAKNRKVDMFGNKEPNKPMLATIFPKSQTADNYAAEMRDFGRTMQYRSGGKVVKTGDEPKKGKKKIGIQIRGFGKARRG